MSSLKRFSSVLAVLLACVLLFSVAFIALEAEHDCIGEHCHICEQVQLCISLLNRVVVLGELLLIMRLAFRLLCAFSADPQVFCGLSSPVSLKVKLSD